MEVGVFEPRPRSSNRIACSVYGCKSKSHKNLELIFHNLPKKNARLVYIKNIFGGIEKIDQLKAWKNALRMGKEVSKNASVCSLHFRKEDYILPNAPSQKRRLKTTAVPSCNLPQSSIDTSKKNEKLKIAREERLLKRLNQQAKVVKTEQSHSTEEEMILVDTLEDIDYESIDESFENFNTVELCHQPNIIQTHDIGVQVTSDFILPKFTQFLTTDTQLNIVTGIETMDILDTIVDIAKTISNDNFNRSGGRLSLRDKIVMVYVKLKQNIPFSFLGIMFNGYTVKHCQRIFFETLSMLSKCLKVAVSWRSKEEISRNISKCFHDFEDVRVVLDSTKIIVQKSKDLTSKNSILLNKTSDTFKIVTGLTPAGNFSFISDLYSSEMSDDDIFNSCKIFNLLEPGDALMIDKGSQYIDELCEMNNCKCVRPTFTKNKKQISQSDVIFTEKIVKALSYIKRSNQRIKSFKIVTDKIPRNLITKVNEIFTVICATLNLSSSVIRNEEFIVIEQLNE